MLKGIVRIAKFFKTKKQDANEIANDVFGYSDDDDLFLDICYPLLVIILLSEIQANPFLTLEEVRVSYNEIVKVRDHAYLSVSAAFSALSKNGKIAWYISDGHFEKLF